MNFQEHPLVIATNAIVSSKTASLDEWAESLLMSSCDPEPSGDNLAALRMCLPRLLRGITEPSDNTCVLMLAGIHRSDCLDECISDEVGAFALALAFLDFTDLYWRGEAPLFSVQQDALALFTQWVGEGKTWDKYLVDAPRMCEAFFGEPWCALALRDASGDYIADQLCIEIVRQVRPPFCPGLCLAQDGLASVLLPDDLGMSD